MRQVPEPLMNVLLAVPVTDDLRFMEECGEIDYRLQQKICSQFFQYKQFTKCQFLSYHFTHRILLLVQVTVEVNFGVNDPQSIVDYRQALSNISHVAIQLRGKYAGSHLQDVSSLENLTAEFNVIVPYTTIGLQDNAPDISPFTEQEMRITQTIKDRLSKSGSVLDVRQTITMKDTYKKKYMIFNAKMAFDHGAFLSQHPENWPLSIIPFNVDSITPDMIYEYRAFPNSVHTPNKIVLQFDFGHDSSHTLDYCDFVWNLFKVPRQNDKGSCVETIWETGESFIYRRFEIRIPYFSQNHWEWLNDVENSRPLRQSWLSYAVRKRYLTPEYEFYYENCGSPLTKVAVMLLDMRQNTRVDVNGFCDKLNTIFRSANMSCQCTLYNPTLGRLVFQSSSIRWYSHLTWMNWFENHNAFEVYNIRWQTLHKFCYPPIAPITWLSSENN